MSVVFRVQDHEGRGPFRPRISQQWIDESAPTPMFPTWMEEFGWNVFERSGGKPGEHFGSACVSISDLCRWFNERERRALGGLGFSIASFSDARILATSPHQVVVARARPFAIGGSTRRWP